MPCMINSCSSVVEQWNPVEFGIANWGLAMVLNRAHSRVFFLSILNSLWCYSLFSQNCQMDLWFPDTRVWVNVVTCLVVTVAFICQLDSISCSDNKVFEFHKAFYMDLTVSQTPQGLSCNLFDKRSQPEYAGIEMIRMPHVHSNISMTAKLGVINTQFYRFLRLCSCKNFFVFQMVSLIVFLKAKGYHFKVLLKRTRGLVLKEKFLFGISAFGIFRMILLRVM